MQETIKNLSENWHVYAPLFIAIFTPIVTFLTQQFKKWLELQKTWKIQLMNYGIGSLISLAGYIVTQGQQSLGFAGGLSGILFVTTTLFYSTGGKWISKLFEDAKETRVNKKLTIEAGTPPIVAVPTTGTFDA